MPFVKPTNTWRSRSTKTLLKSVAGLIGGVMLFGSAVAPAQASDDIGHVFSQWSNVVNCSILTFTDPEQKIAEGCGTDGPAGGDIGFEGGGNGNGNDVMKPTECRYESESDWEYDYEYCEYSPS